MQFARQLSHLKRRFVSTATGIVGYVALNPLFYFSQTSTQISGKEMYFELTSVLLITATLFSRTFAYFITVDAHAEECFFDNVEAGTKMGKYCTQINPRIAKFPSFLAALTFEIAEGGFLDIDVRIFGPDNKVIHQGERESSGKYTFAAHTKGVYTYCFSNKMSTMTPKVVMFNMEIGEAPKSPERSSESATKLEDMIHELSSKFLIALSNVI